MNIYLTFPYKFIAEESLEVKLPTIWTDEKAGQGRGREKRKIRRKKSRRERRCRCVKR